MSTSSVCNMDLDETKILYDSAELKKMELAENIRGTKKRLDYLIAAFDCASASAGYQPALHHYHQHGDGTNKKNSTGHSGPSSWSSVSSATSAGTNAQEPSEDGVHKQHRHSLNSAVSTRSHNHTVVASSVNSNLQLLSGEVPEDGGQKHHLHSVSGVTACSRSNHYAIVSAVSSLGSKDTNQTCQKRNDAKQRYSKRPNITTSTKTTHKMVQERTWSDLTNGTSHRNNTSSDEDQEIDYRLPGIVKRMKDKYISLTLKQTSTWSRPTILRKATSLEDLLDDDKFVNTTEDEGDGSQDEGDSRRNRSRYAQRNGNDNSVVPHRYHRSGGRRVEMKRARSVEPISRSDDVIPTLSDVTANNRQSLHEDILINMAAEMDLDSEKPQLKNCNNKTISNENDCDNVNSLKFVAKMNRPKRLQPIVSENEKPPVDFVKQVKMIFEKRPEQRTKKPPHTGDVAAKIDNFNSIIVKAKAAKKPLIKHTKPVLHDKTKSNTQSQTQQQQHHTHIRPSAKPVILTEDMTTLHHVKPKTLDLKTTKLHSPTTIKSPTSFLPSPTNRERSPLLSPVQKINQYNNSRPTEKDNNDMLLLCTVNNYTNKKPPLEDRPYVPSNNKTQSKPKDVTDTLSSPIPDVSRTDYDSDTSNKNSSLSETPDLLLTANRMPVTSSPTFEKNSATEDFLLAEILQSSALPMGSVDTRNERYRPPLESPKTRSIDSEPLETSPGYKPISAIGQNNISKNSTSTTFNFLSAKVDQAHLPTNADSPDVKIPHLEPLRVDVSVVSIEAVRIARNGVLSPVDVAAKTGLGVKSVNNNLVSPQPPLNIVTKTNNVSVVSRVNSPPPPTKTTSAGKQSSVGSAEPANTVLPVAKKKKPRQHEPTTTAVFNFTDRKDVPDYIANDKSRSPVRPELPKTGEGGIIRLPGQLFEDSFLDEEEEILRSLECPPSPCDVTFINDNILIEGRSSLSASAKKIKMKIKFIEELDIYEYPSETSLLIDEVPSLSGKLSEVKSLGSTLANYTPKLTVDFQPGVTKPPDVSVPVEPSPTSELIVEEIDMPFSAGKNSDMLF